MAKRPQLIQWQIVDKETIDEIIFRTTSKRSRFMLELLARGGMRVGEVLNLTPGDIQERSLIIQKTKSGRLSETVVRCGNLRGGTPYLGVFGLLFFIGSSIGISSNGNLTTSAVNKYWYRLLQRSQRSANFMIPISLPAARLMVRREASCFPLSQGWWCHFHEEGFPFFHAYIVVFLLFFANSFWRFSNE